MTEGDAYALAGVLYLYFRVESCEFRGRTDIRRRLRKNGRSRDEATVKDQMKPFDKQVLKHLLELLFRSIRRHGCGNGVKGPRRRSIPEPRETRKFPGYALVVDKGGPKFREVAPTPAGKPDEPRNARGALSGPRGADGFPVVSGSTMLSQSGPGGQRWKYQERTMAEFLSNLGNVIGILQGNQPGSPTPRIVDKTGLTGKYTLILEFYNPNAPNGAGRLVQAGAAPDVGNAAAPVASEPGSALPNIFVAIQKQLGLRLDKTADVALDVIVVDSVDKVPTEN